MLKKKILKLLPEHTSFKTATWIALWVMALLIPLAWGKLRRPNLSEAAWFDNNWGYRKQVPLSNSSGATKSNFQINLTIDTATLVTAGKLQSDCDDLRFTDQNGKLLSYWIEPTTCNTATTKVWVKVSTIPSATTGTTTNIYYYYGNPTAAKAPEAGNPGNVFIRDMEQAAVAWPLDDTTTTQSYSRVENPAVALGREIVLNGGFDNTSNWSGSSWTVENGGVTGASTTALLYQSSTPIVTGKSYQVTFTISSYTSGSVKPYIGGTQGTARSAVGTYTETVVAGSANTWIGINGTVAFIGVIDNVSVKQVTIPTSTSFNGTEKLGDGNMETADTASWTGARATLTKETLSPHGGTRLLRATSTATGGAAAYCVQHALTAGKTYRINGYARSDGTVTPKILHNSTTFWTGTNSTSWQYFDITLVAGSTDVRLEVGSAPPAGNYAEFDDLSVIEVDPLVGKPTNGVTLGSSSGTGGHSTNAYTFDGSDDYVNIYSSDLNSVFNQQEGTAIVWAKVANSGIWSDNATRNIINVRADASNMFGIQKSTDSKIYGAYIAGGTQQNVSFSTTTTDWFMTAISWSKSNNQFKVYFNGVQTGATQTGLGTWTGNLSSTASLIGNIQTANQTWSGMINDTRLYTRALSADEIASLYNSSSDRQAYTTANYAGRELIRQYDANVTVGAAAAEETSFGPIAYWMLDEGTGQTIQDSSRKNNGGTLGADANASTDDPTWKAEDQCVSGKCLFFDGGDHLQGTGANLPNVGNTANISLSAWVKITSSSGRMTVFNKGQSGSCFNYGMVINNGILTARNTSSDYSLVGTVPVNTWTHVLIVFNSSGATGYINGQQVGANATATTKTCADNNWAIGKRAYNASSDYLSGFIDDVKVYPQALTADQIKKEFNNNSAVIIGSTSTQNSPSNGLIGYWKMDEVSGAGSTLADSSGKSNTLTASLYGSGNTATDSAHVVGKFGSGFNFDGNDDYLSLASIYTPNSDSFTTASWFKLDSSVAASTNINTIFGNNQITPLLGYKPSDKKFYSYRQYGASSQTVLSNATTNNLADLTWHHIAMVVNQSNYTVNFYLDGQLLNTATIGTEGYNSNGSLYRIGYPWLSSTSGWHGTLDEVRLYQRAISDKEVRDLYSWAPGPVSYWNFDEGSGTSAADKGSNGLTGTLNNGPTWTNGKFGKAIRFNYDSDLNQTVSFTQFDTPNQFTKEAWINPATISGCDDTRCSIIGQYFEISSNRLEYYDNNLTTKGWHVGGTIALNTWQHVAVTYDGALLKLYINGKQVNSTAVTQTSSVHPSSFIGGYNGTIRSFRGDIDEVKIYNYARTSGQITEDMNAGHPIGGSPIGSQVGYWKFDEGNGTRINNYVSTNYNATLYNTTKTTWTDAGKINKGLNFDGTTAQVIAENTGADFKYNGGDMTWTAWIKTDPTDDGGNIISKPWNGLGQYNYRIYTSSGSTPTINVAFNGATNFSTFTTTGISSNVWHHIAVSLEGSTRTLNIYVDGMLARTATNTITDWTPSSGDSTLKIVFGCIFPYGNDSCAGATGHAFKGSMDEIKYYQSFLTAEQVKQDMNAGSAMSFGNVLGASESADLADGGGNPPVAEWKMDENSGTTLNDTSGNNKTLTLTGSPTWGLGKFGNGLTFSGNGSQYAGVTDSGTTTLDVTGNITFEAWVYWNRFKDYGVIMQKGSSGSAITFNYAIWSYAASVYCYVANGTGNNAVAIPASSISTGQWHHIACVANGSTLTPYLDGRAFPSANQTITPTANDYPFYIGSIGSGFTIDGKIDQARIYNYARTPAQVAYNFNRGGPVSYWRLDECNGTTANDAAGNNPGAITIGATGTQTAAGTCNTSGSAWGNGLTGKYNGSLNFDGTDDYINIPGPATNLQITGAITISSWIKTTKADYQVIIDDLGGSPYTSWTQWLMPAGTVGWYDNGTWKASNKVVNDGSWHHVVTVVDSSNTLRFYIDGVLDVNSYPNVSARTATTDAKAIGRRADANTYMFSGQIDDVQVYNYALSASQITKLYNQNSAFRFGPN
jgi:hypothetical protein